MTVALLILAALFALYAVMVGLAAGLLAQDGERAWQVLACGAVALGGIAGLAAVVAL